MDRMDRSAIQTTVGRVLDDAIALGLVFEQDRFRKLFAFKITPGRRATGGTKSSRKYPNVQRPFINLGVQSRHTSRERGMACSGEKPRKHTEAVWRQAYEEYRKDRWLFVEYAHLHNDQVMGGFVSDDASHHCLAIICHEMSHSVQMWNYHIQKEAAAEGVKIPKPVSHGHEFQVAYKALRQRYGLVRRAYDLGLDEGLLMEAA